MLYALGRKSNESTANTSPLAAGVINQLSAKSKLYSIDALMVKRDGNGKQTNGEWTNTSVASGAPSNDLSGQQFSNEFVPRQQFPDVTTGQQLTSRQQLPAELGLCKHATTPTPVAAHISRDDQTHSPQLPAPSPNYPVQTKISSAHCTIVSPPDKTSNYSTQLQPKQQQHYVQQEEHFNASVAVAQVPNTNVPIHIIHINSLNASNNDAPQMTSQGKTSDLCKQKQDGEDLKSAQEEPRTETNTEFQTETITIKAKTFKSKHTAPQTNHIHNNNNHDYVNYNECIVQQMNSDNKPNNDTSLKLCANLCNDKISRAIQSLHKTTTTAPSVITSTWTKQTSVCNTTLPSCNKTAISSTFTLPSFSTTVMSAMNGYVLNVPQVNLQTTMTTSSDLLSVRRTRSKLDLAAKRRRLRRERRTTKKIKIEDERKENETRTSYEYGVRVCGYSSESSSSDDWTSESDYEMKIDMWIRKGPPLKGGIGRDKKEFLNIFGLTTHQERNDVELHKLKRRKWAPCSLLLLEDNNDDHRKDRTDRLDLPVPFESPSLLNRSADFHRKSGFLHDLGLKTVSTQQRQDLEKYWIKVVRQRLKRNALTPLSQYYLNFGKKLATLKETNKDDVILSIPKFKEIGQQTELQVPIPFNRNALRNSNNTNVTNVLTTIQHATLYNKSRPEQNEFMNVVVLKQPVYSEYCHNGGMMHGIVPPEINPEAKMASARQSTDANVYSVQACITNMVKEMITTTANTMTIIEPSDDAVVVLCKQQENGLGKLKRKLSEHINMNCAEEKKLEVDNENSFCEKISLCEKTHFKLSFEKGNEKGKEKTKEFSKERQKDSKLQPKDKTMATPNLQPSMEDWSMWPGIAEMMVCYANYSKTRSHEIESLKRKCEAQRKIVEKQQAEVKRYEARQTELRKVSTTCSLKRHNMEKSIDRLTHILQDFKTSNR